VGLRGFGRWRRGADVTPLILQSELPAMEAFSGRNTLGPLRKPRLSTTQKLADLPLIQQRARAIAPC